jgi:hypothetical protein
MNCYYLCRLASLVQCLQGLFDGAELGECGSDFIGRNGRRVEPRPKAL